MSNSILTSIKKLLGIDEAYTAFDVDVLMHINSAFATLHQLGVGPVSAYYIEDKSAEWSSFIEGETYLNSVKSLVYLRVKLLFDPPSTSFGIDSMKETAKEYEWRLNVAAEQGLIIPAVPNDSTDIWLMDDEDTDLPEGAVPGDLGIDPETGNVWMYT